MNRFNPKNYLFLSLVALGYSSLGFAAPSTLDVKKKGEYEVKQIAEPVLTQFCHDQCKVINVDVEVDVAIDEDAAPGFEESAGKASLAPASAKLKVLVDNNLGKQTQYKIVELLKTNLESLKYPVQVETTSKAFPLPPAANYKVAELRERVYREVKQNIQSMLTQFCGNHCVLGEFDLQSEQVNSEDIDYGSSQEYFQDGPAAIKVKNVRASVMVDQSLSPEEGNTVVEMVKLKVSQFKNAQVTSQAMKFPKPIEGTQYGRNGLLAGNGLGADDKNETNKNVNNESQSNSNLNKSETNDSKSNHSMDSKEQLTKTDTYNKNEKGLTTNNNSVNDHKQEKFERFEKIERVENGDAVQQKLETFRMYAIGFAAVILALLVTLVAISFRSVLGDKSKPIEVNHKNDGHSKGHGGSHSPVDSGNLTSDEKATLIGRRLEADRLLNELTNIFSEQPKVAKHVFAQVITEEGVETTAQYVELFGESIMLDLLRDPGLQADLAELMDFYARNTFDLNEEERLHLLKRLDHRTTAAKMLVHGTRSATLFDFLAEMDAPQIFEMIKNESNTVKAIVLTQCDTKKRQSIFGQHDETNRIKLMTELSRIDHLPKNYIFNVASALRRKKAENPKLNTEALPGTDVLVSFLERSNMDTQRNILTQLLNSSGDILQSLKAKLVSVETIRFIKDSQLVEVVTGVKHEELIHFLQGCSQDVKEAVLSKGPQDLTAEIRDQLHLAEPVTRETYFAVERKVLNRIKILANQGMINLNEVNERMFAQEFGYNVSHHEIGDDYMRKVS